MNTRKIKNYLSNVHYHPIMTRTFNVIVEEGEDGYLISEVVELPGCHTQAKSYDELIKRTKEAIELYLTVEKPVSGIPTGEPQLFPITPGRRLTGGFSIRLSDMT